MNPRKALKAWREQAGPDGDRLTFDAAAKMLGLTHSTWHEWESGRRTPSLELAFEVERITDGKIPVEAWGFPRVDERIDTIREVLSRRDLAKASGA